VVLVVLGSVALVLLLICSGVVGVIWWGYSSVASATSSPTGNSRPTSSSSSLSGNRFSSSPSRSGSSNSTAAPPASVAEALAALKEIDSRRIEQGADYLAAAQVESARRAEVERALLAHASHGSSSTRQKVLRALFRWGGVDSVTTVANALKDRGLSGSDVRSAIDFLGKQRDVRGAEAVAAYLADRSAGENAASALIAIGPGAQPHVVAALNDDDSQRRAEQVLATYGVDAADTLLTSRLAALKQSDWTKARDAVRWLADAEVAPQRRAEVARALEAVVEGNHAVFVREDGMRALKKWGDKESVPALARMLENHSLRDKALEVLVSLNDPSAAEPIAALLDDFSLGDRAALALRKLGPTTKAHVLKYLHDDDSRTRDRVRSLLAAMEVPESELLAQTLEDLRGLDAKRQRTAAESLAAAPIDAAQQTAIAEQLARLASSSDFHLQRAAVAALARWGTSAQAPQLLALLESHDSQVMRAALDNLLAMDDPSLATSLAHQLGLRLKDSSVRGTAFIALQKAGPKAEDVLIGLLNPLFEGEVVLLAVQLLSTNGTEKSLTPLSKLAEYARRNNNLAISSAASAAQGAIRKRAAPAEPSPAQP
jgi:HEAT repeat protein